ncbi:unnamed protein product [Closterium sp. Yama58-4]|nr:unnamed protein product [Closterium sp. Yama58-4]
MARTCQVVFPQPWRQFWAWHALSQAQQVNSAHLKFDWDAYDFSAPCRKFWARHALSQAQQVNSAHLKFDWDAYDFSAPCRKVRGAPHVSATPSTPNPHRLPNRLPHPPPAPLRAPPLLLPLPPPHHVPPLARSTSPAGPLWEGGAAGEVAWSAGELRGLLQQRIARHSAVAGVMVSPGYDDMLNNWVCYVKELQIRNFFIITQDPAHAFSLKRRGFAVYCAGACGEWTIEAKRASAWLSPAHDPRTPGRSPTTPPSLLR